MFKPQLSPLKSHENPITMKKSPILDNNPIIIYHIPSMYKRINQVASHGW